MMKYKFEKEDNGNWYVVLPEWIGEKADLQMVLGADTMLDMLSDNKKEVSLNISLEPFDNSLHLKKVKDCSPNMGGADYILEEFQKERIDLDVWLCAVTEFVFGFMPNDIYFEKTITRNFEIVDELMSDNLKKSLEEKMVSVKEQIRKYTEWYDEKVKENDQLNKDK